MPLNPKVTACPTACCRLTVSTTRHKTHTSGAGAIYLQELAVGGLRCPACSINRLIKPFHRLQVRLRGLFKGATAFCNSLAAAEGKAIGDKKGGWAGVGELAEAVKNISNFPVSNREVVMTRLSGSAG